DAGPLTALNSTIVGNGISGIDLVEAEATITNTIVYGNSTSDCTPGVTSGGGNIDGDDTCNLTAEADQPSTDPLLGPLADNGGPTLTHLPSAGSPAIDRALEGPCPPVDQRGLPRPVDGDGDGTSGCDVGSVEVQVDEPVEPVTPTTPPAGTDTTRVVEPRFTG